MIQALLASLLLSAAPADSVLSAERVGPVVVEGRRVSPPAPVFTLSRRWLDTKHPRDMREALEGVSGLRLIQLGGAESMPSIRGLGPGRVAVLWDGKPLNTAQGGGVDLSGVDPGSLERIEVARGAVGALYGPYALGGAVNLVPRESGPGETVLRLTGGGGESLRGRGRMRRLSGPWSVDAVADARRFRDQQALSWSRSVHANALRTAAAGNQIQGSASWSEDSRAVPGPKTAPSPEARRRDRRFNVSGGLRGLEGAAGYWDGELSLQHIQRRYQDPGSPLGAVEDTHRNTTLRAWTAVETAPGFTWRGEFTHHALNSSTDGERARWEGALASRFTLPRGFSGALRVDWLESFHPALSGRLQGEHNLAAGLWLRSGVGTAFRAPTFDDLFWPARAAAAGNRDLEPERGYDLNAGLLWRHPWVEGEITAYAMEVRDWIQWTPGVDGIWRPHNTDAVHLYGLEASLALPGRGWRPGVDASYTWSESRDAGDDPNTGGKNLVGRPQHRMFLEARWDRGPWTWGGGLTAVGPIPLTAANTKWQPGYTLVHAVAHRELGPHLLLELEGRNLLDTVYEDIRGYATQKRRLYLGITWRDTAP